MRRLAIEHGGRFAPSVFLLNDDQLLPLSYHVYDNEIIHMGLRSFIPQRGTETMNAAIMIRNQEIALRLRADFMTNWKKFGPLTDSQYSNIINQLGEIGPEVKKEAIEAVNKLISV